MRYDYAVIGSGFGGSIVAGHLARAGARVLVLERGPWRDTAPVRALGVAERSPLPQGWAALGYGLRAIHAAPLPAGGLRLNRRGMYELFRFAGLDVLCSSGVGGGSHAYAGLLAPPVDPDYWRHRHPALDPETVERHYPAVRAELGASPLHAGRHAHTVWSALAPLAGSGFAPSAEQPWVGTWFPDGPAPPAGLRQGREPSRCEGDSFLGSPAGAKATADIVYLAPALAAGAELRALTELRWLARQPAGGYRLEVRDLGRRGAGPETLEAERVVLAAGTLNTLRLLSLSSAGAQPGLAAMPALGRSFGGNTDRVALWRREGGLSSLRAPACLGRFDPPDGGRSYLVLGSFAGLQALPLPGPLRRALERRLLVIVMAADSGAAVLRLLPGGRLDSDYAPAREPTHTAARQLFRTFAAAAGSRLAVPRRPLTVHPWGGARLGADPAQGVVDHRGEVYGNPGLYLADGAVLPAAPGGPPTLAIAAWAHQVGRALTQRA